jgi:hypothetical protein
MCTHSVIVLQVISYNSFDYVLIDYLVIALITWRIKLIVLQVISCSFFDYLVIALIIL